MPLMLQYAKSILLWTGIVFFLLYLVRKKHIHRKRDVFFLLLAAYIVGICSVTLFPAVDFGIDSATGKPYIDFHFRTREMRGLNLVPLKTILAQITGSIPELAQEERLTVGIGNLVGNICMYLPVGFLLPLSKERFKGFGTVIVFTLVLSCFIEIIQYFIGRSADIDDILLHLLGAVIGYGLWRAAVKLGMKNET